MCQVYPRNSILARHIDYWHLEIFGIICCTKIVIEKIICYRYPFSKRKTNISTSVVKTKKLIGSYPFMFAKIAVSLATLLLLFFYSLGFHFRTEATYAPISPIATTPKVAGISIFNEPDPETFTEASETKVKEERRKLEEAKRVAEHEAKVANLISYLKRNNSPVANHKIANIIITESAKYGADYKVVVAIMGVESGLCRQSFWYNCFGYLNGVRYSSYEHAFSDLVPKVSRQYAAKYGWNFEALAKAYGQHNWEKTSANMRWFASRI